MSILLDLFNAGNRKNIWQIKKRIQPDVVLEGYHMKWCRRRDSVERQRFQQVIEIIRAIIDHK